tara:strand:+ start:155 stop:727 length:573 start_codon:yes stop_codon:yes gene_type:complete
MPWKKVLNEGHIGIDFPSFSHSHETGLQPSEFTNNSAGDSFDYSGTEYALANLITGMAGYTLNDNGMGYIPGRVISLFTGTQWQYANNLPTHANKVLGIYLGNDPDANQIKILTEGYIALPSSIVDPSVEDAMTGGKVIYLSPENGLISSIPNPSASRILRQLGYCLKYTAGVGGVFYFKPESVYIQTRP